MPRGDKSKYTDKQERQAEHIEESYQKQGASKEDAESRAWATVNKMSGGGNKPGGSGYGQKTDTSAAKRGGKKGGAKSGGKKAAAKKGGAKKGATKKSGTKKGSAKKKG